MAFSITEALSHYRYDPLDRLASHGAFTRAETHVFYRQNSLTTEIQGAVQTSWLQTPDRLLAQQRLEASHRKGALLATDAPNSVVHVLSDQQRQGFAYLPYGLRHPDSASLLLPGFNGERLDPVTGHYLLGNGYRAFNPVLMRFNSPDSLSPFGEGGLNAYAYCAGDPVNQVDPTGKISRLWALVKSNLSHIKKMAPHVSAKSQGNLLETFEGTPHIFEQIVSQLPGSSLTNLASTSSYMKTIVYSISDMNIPKATPTLRSSKSALESMMRGDYLGILPVESELFKQYQAVQRQYMAKVAADKTLSSGIQLRDPRGRRTGFVHIGG